MDRLNARRVAVKEGLIDLKVVRQKVVIMQKNELMPVRARLASRGTASRALTAALLAPLLVTGVAGAQEIEAMATSVTGGVETVQTAVFAIISVVVLIGLGVWAARHLRPKGG